MIFCLSMYRFVHRISSVIEMAYHISNIQRHSLLVFHHWFSFSVFLLLLFLLLFLFDKFYTIFCWWCFTLYEFCRLAHGCRALAVAFFIHSFRNRLKLHHEMEYIYILWRAQIHSSTNRQIETNICTPYFM